MRVVSCSLLQQTYNMKITNRNKKKKKKLHECAKLAQNMLFFYQTMNTNYFLQTIQYRKKTQKAQKKITIKN